MQLVLELYATGGSVYISFLIVAIYSTMKVTMLMDVMLVLSGLLCLCLHQAARPSAGHTVCTNCTATLHAARLWYIVGLYKNQIIQMVHVASMLYTAMQHARDAMLTPQQLRLHQTRSQTL